MKTSVDERLATIIEDLENLRRAREQHYGRIDSHDFLREQAYYDRSWRDSGTPAMEEVELQLVGLWPDVKAHTDWTEDDMADAVSSPGMMDPEPLTYGLETLTSRL